MGLPLVLAEALGNQAVRQIVVGVGTGLAGSALAKTFDDTSKNICACLDKIDKTLISGFAGRDIETERLQKALDVVKANISKTSDALKGATKALEKAQSKPGTFAGVDEFARQNSATVELRRLQDAQKALEEQLAARAKALEAERASRRVQPGDGAQAAPSLLQLNQTLVYIF